MTAFAQRISAKHNTRFVFLDRRRYDINATVTVLGCTLWSEVASEQASDVARLLTDFHEQYGIRGWTLDSHMQEHRKDLAWFNVQVEKIQQHEPQRQIIVLTHHCPTIDSRTTNPKHKVSRVRSAFQTDLSSELCWRSPQVKLWAFGHTHYSCCFRDDATGKLVIANQKGYDGLAMIRVDWKPRVVEMTAKGCALKDVDQWDSSHIHWPNGKAHIPVEAVSRRPVPSILQQAVKRISSAIRPKR
ncbi:hypothetical protein LTS18_011578 [Coniosporium uncinatum]|uniref:Uncharacterized protein n=1 Tax=Coniosporium uncinatum TaxID=93489 RepID=A0ACC3CYD5_9PEZI|nr:hypothetical protein LTS18_011578 [Coniosporium uncinatum]